MTYLSLVVDGSSCFPIFLMGGYLFQLTSPLRARLVDYLFPMSKVLKIRVGRSGKKKKEKKRQKYL